MHHPKSRSKSSELSILCLVMKHWGYQCSCPRCRVITRAPAKWGSLITEDFWWQEMCHGCQPGVTGHCLSYIARHLTVIQRGNRETWIIILLMAWCWQDPSHGCRGLKPIITWLWHWLSHPSLLKGCVICAVMCPAAQHWLSGVWWMLITTHRWRLIISSPTVYLFTIYQKSLYLSRPNWFVGYGHSV